MSKITKTQCVFSLHITTYISVVVCVITLINTLNSERTPFFVCGMHLSNTENNDTVPPPYSMLLGSNSVGPPCKWSMNRHRHSMYSYAGIGSNCTSH